MAKPQTAVPTAVTTPDKGAAVVASPEVAREPVRPAAQAVPITVPTVASRPLDPPSRVSRTDITGPSFLGLNSPPDGQSGRDAARRGSGSLDYLLEDEEEPKRGWGKLFLVVIALALIGGFGYLRWKQGGFNFLKPAPAAQSSPSPADSANTAGTAASPEAATANPASPASAPPNGEAANSGTPNSGTPNPGTPNATSPSGQSSGATTPDAAASGAGSGTGGAASGTESARQPAAAQSSAPDNASEPKPKDDASGDKAEGTEAVESAEAEPRKPESRVAPSTKPSAARPRERKPTPATPLDPTVEAERYIYGRGVPQDCDRGLRLLKPAAAQANAKAMISLGTLYSSGTCTPRDLPTAYRWFAMALHKQPDNQPLQDDLQKLWSQMTGPERQLAIKLSQ